MERISWLYYFQLDRFIFERESGVWQFYLRNRLFCKHMWRNSVLGQMERLSIKCFFLTSCFSSYCEPIHITLHVHHWNKTKKNLMKRWKKWCLTIIFPHKIHKIWGEICDICNMGCYNVTSTSKNSGTFESDSLFGQKYW